MNSSINSNRSVFPKKGQQSRKHVPLKSPSMWSGTFWYVGHKNEAGKCSGYISSADTATCFEVENRKNPPKLQSTPTLNVVVSCFRMCEIGATTCTASTSGWTPGPAGSGSDAWSLSSDRTLPGNLKRQYHETFFILSYLE
jgi:hypothetical protein